MSFRYVETSTLPYPRGIEWTCDHTDCSAQEITEDTGDRVVYLKPSGWESILITSMHDGDHGYHLCDSHARELRSTFKEDVDLHNNLQAVGY